MPITLAYAGLVFGALLGGMIAHELTHVAAAYAAGGRGHVHWRAFFSLSGTVPVTWEIPASHPRWVDRLINLSPLLTGLTAAALATAVDVLPAFDFTGLPVLVGWAFYTLGGGLADYVPAAARGDEWWWSRRASYERMGLMGVALLLAGAASQSIFVQTCTGGAVPLPAACEVDRLMMTARYVGQAVGVAGYLSVCWAAVEAVILDERNRASRA